MNGNQSESSPTLLGHPPGLFTLFFAEMWERFSYYGMRALLLFYMIKGFLGYNDAKAYAVYGAYTSLVYATPFIGGMLADRLLGQRFAVILGGLLMSAGHLAMTAENEFIFFLALALLIIGNGFFKPNISTMVGDHYPKASDRKDTGFTIFYMGINLGAALSPILCGYVGETYGWHKGFGLATAGMLVGTAIFVAPTRLTQVLILFGALLTAVSLIFQQQLEPAIASLFNLDAATTALTSLQIGTRVFLGIALLISGAVAIAALNKGGIPEGIGAPPSKERLQQKPFHGQHKESLLIYRILVGVCGLGLLSYALIKGETLNATCYGIALAAGLLVPHLKAVAAVLVGSLGVLSLITVLLQGSIAGYILITFGILALIYLLIVTFQSPKVERERMFVVLILTFFSMLFWAFFEQAGSSMNNFADRNVDRAEESRRLTDNDIGTTIAFRVPIKTTDTEIRALPLLSQEQLGYENNGTLFNMTQLSELRDAVQKAEEGDSPTLRVEWPITEAHVGMGILEEDASEIPASEFQAANAIFILIFGLVFTAIWGFLRARGWEPSTPVKFALGLLQVGLGFVALWYGAQICDSRGMVGMVWLLLAYLLHTTGELCLSPVGLSMVTKLSPARIVSTVMGTWFLATAFSNYLAALIAMLTRVSDGGEEQVVPAPIETVSVYGGVFGKIAIVAIASAIICLALTPLLKRWMHLDKPSDDEPIASTH